MRAHARTTGLIVAMAGGLACQLLGYGTTSSGSYPSSGSTSGSSAADRERAEYAAKAAQRELEEQDQVTAAEIERQRHTAEQDKTPEAILAFSDALLAAFASGAVERGTVNGPNNLQAARDLLAEAMQTEATAPMQLASARFAYLAGEVDVAITHYEAVMAAEPSVVLFEEMRQLPSTPEVDAGLVRSCGPVRGLVGDDQLFALVDECLARAGGNRKKLAWKGSKKDLRFYDAELDRIAEEERLAAEAAALAAAEAEAEEAKSEQFVMAAVFAAGDCDFGDCAGNGWTTQSDAGTVRSRCNFGKCLSDGWETTFPDGSTARTRCNFSKCLEDGWETTFPDGSSARTSCSFGKCETDGWETRLPDGSTARTSCNFSKCFTDGWQTSLPTGGSVRCDCKFGDCLGNGTECR